MMTMLHLQELRPLNNSANHGGWCDQHVSCCLEYSGDHSEGFSVAEQLEENMTNAHLVHERHVEAFLNMASWNNQTRVVQEMMGDLLTWALSWVPGIWSLRWWNRDPGRWPSHSESRTRPSDSGGRGQKLLGQCRDRCGVYCQLVWSCFSGLTVNEKLIKGQK